VLTRPPLRFYCSAAAFGFEQAIDVPSGFLVIGKNDGAISLVDARDDANVIITDITTGSNDGTCRNRATGQPVVSDALRDAICRSRNVRYVRISTSTVVAMTN